MKNMKFLFILLLTCLFVLCGCGNSNNGNNNSNAERMSYKKETTLSTFSTNILDKTPNRVDNIALTCSKINEVIVKSGQTFSFCDTVGEVSAKTGYKEADILDAKGKPFKGFGGGNCQVSTTLYNAVTAIDDIVVTERHNHSKRVYYIEKNKDAAVDSSSKLDFKFNNNTKNDIKIYASSTKDQVTIRIVSLE